MGTLCLQGHYLSQRSLRLFLSDKRLRCRWIILRKCSRRPCSAQSCWGFVAAARPATSVSWTRPRCWSDSPAKMIACFKMDYFWTLIQILLTFLCVFKTWSIFPSCCYTQSAIHFLIEVQFCDEGNKCSNNWPNNRFNLVCFCHSLYGSLSEIRSPNRESYRRRDYG